MGTGKFNSNDHYIYYCGQEPFRRNGVALIVNKRGWNAVLGCNLKNKRMISVHFQGKPFNIIAIQVYAPITNAEEAEQLVLWRPTRSFRTNTQKRCPFHYRDWNANEGSQETPGVTGKFVLRAQNEAEQRLTVLLREHTGHSKHSLLTTQDTALHMDITIWSILKSGWLSSLQPKMEKL